MSTRPPHHHSHSSTTSATTSSRLSTSLTPKPPTSIHPTALVPDHLTLAGTHPITIGANTIIHPRAKIYSHDAPVRIGEGVVIGEKSVIGFCESTRLKNQRNKNGETVVGDEVVIAPAARICAFAVVGRRSVVESRGVVGLGCRIGAYVKVCAGVMVGDKGEDLSSSSSSVGGGKVMDEGSDDEYESEDEEEEEEGEEGLDVPDWTVVVPGGRLGARRVRDVRQEGIVEEARLRGLTMERKMLRLLLAKSSGKRR